MSDALHLLGLDEEAPRLRPVREEAPGCAVCHDAPALVGARCRDCHNAMARKRHGYIYPLPPRDRTPRVARLDGTNGYPFVSASDVVNYRDD